VVDARTGEPLAGVQVRIDGDARAFVTDRDGRFRIDDAPEGPQTLSVSMVGYAMARRDVVVASTPGVALLVPLVQGTGAFTEHVTVTGARGAAGEAVPALRTLESRDMQDLGTVLADDPLRAAQALPGVAWNDDFRAELSVRGNGPRHVGFSIDDVPTPWLVHAVLGRGDDTGSIALVNGDIVDRISLAPGVHPQRLGDRTGAWLETTIREGSRDATGVRGSLSVASASVVAEGPIGTARRGSWLISARQSYLDWLLRQVAEDGEQQSFFGFTDTQAKVGFDLTPRQHLELTVVAGRSRLDEADPEPGPNSIGEGHARTGLVTIGLRSTVDASLFVSQRAWATGRRFWNVGEFAQELARGSGREIGYRADVSWSPTAAALVEFGGDAALRRESLVVRQFSAAPPAGPPTLAYANGADVSSRVASTYAQLRWKGSGGVWVSPGVRVTGASITGGTDASPWLLAGWSGGPSLHARVGTAVQYQAPDAHHVRGLTGNENVASERARHLDASLAQERGRWRWEVGVFDRRDEDYLRQGAAEPRRVDGRVVTGNPLGQWENALQGSARGVEAMIERRVAQGWGGWLGYAYGRSKYKDLVSQEEFWGDYDQRHALTVYGYHQLSARTRASARLRMGSNFPIPGYLGRAGEDALTAADRRNLVRLPPYARLDLNVSRAFFWSSRRLTLFAEIINVTSRANYRAGRGTIRTRTGEAVGFVEELLPLLPAAGLMIEF
jgi:hypothetical protein